MSPTTVPSQGQDGVPPVGNGSYERLGETLAILGCGHMGTAILLGVLSALALRSKPDSSDLLPSRFRACVRHPEAADRIRSRLPLHALDTAVTLHVNDNLAAVERADMVLLACQPHLFEAVLGEPGLANALQGKLVMSVLAGVTSEEIESSLERAATRRSGGAFSVVRIMPNIASAVQASSTVLEARGSNGLHAQFAATVGAIFSCVGATFTTPPETFPICTTLNGSTPAFFAMVVDGLVDGAVALGLSRAEATRMVAATMRGTAELMLAGKDTHDLRYEVACPGGATMQGIRVLEEARTRGVWMDAVRVTTSKQSGLRDGL
ncbi:pyrroline-5-carboxylate reductase [Daldinia decipiens]|uniref:pyrroline-5-carboxylate reductase n=1 Tax=Daldinia decipiens TaxID=326647 RepID=UPI0020C475B6|nr:pyrroline-5-carboxylate reductase [Daldinia decipiens]KAI1654731.1 pyrroline-5-carboxylate reductase [Daldinia decipiens]